MQFFYLKKEIKLQKTELDDQMIIKLNDYKGELWIIILN